MKGIFKTMKGKRFGNKKGGSLVAVMTTMAVLSIVALCAASIALTNYRTTKTYTAQDNYYYSAEAGQAQFVANLNDVAYNKASSTEWNFTDELNYKKSVEAFYADIIKSANEFTLDDNVYNGEYTVTNSIEEVSNGVYYVLDGNDAVITIKTVVTNTEDGSTQEYYSTITITAPSAETDNNTQTDSTTSYYEIKGEVPGQYFNKEYSLFTNGSGKNNDWYAVWGGFNTYWTTKNRTTPLTNKNSAGKLFSVSESNGKSDSLKTGIFQKDGSNENVAGKPSNYTGSHFFRTNGTTTNGDKSTINNFMNGINVNIQQFIDDAGNSNSVQKVTGNELKLDLKDRDSKITGAVVMNKDEKFYINTNGSDFTLKFEGNPADDVVNGTYSKEYGIIHYKDVTDSSGKKLFDGKQPLYRVVLETDIRNGHFFFAPFKTEKTTHGIAYQYKSSTYPNGRTKLPDGYSDSKTYTYIDHYFQNKWFFVDLNGGTLRIDNSTSTIQTSITDYEWKNIFHFRYGEKDVTEFGCTDAYGFYNYPALGNIVMEDCYFFVNGNISIANAYNFSNCKVFATGDIILEKAYYLEGLLSLETDAGSNIIEQSLYYCLGQFRSELVSRYSMAWNLTYENEHIQTQLLYGVFVPVVTVPRWYTSGYQKLSHTPGFDNWPVFDFATNSDYKDCLLDNGNTYPVNTVSHVPDYIMGLIQYYVETHTETTGQLISYRYPTVLKATIIAKGTDKSFTPREAVINNNRTTNIKENNSTYKTDGVSVVLNPDGGTYGVVDAVLIEGQIFSAGKTYATNYNWYDDNDYNFITNDSNRYAASSQVQYKPYNPYKETSTPSIGGVLGSITEEVTSEITSTVYKPLLIQNGGIYQK